LTHSDQPLSDSARHYIERLWSLLESDAQSRLIELEKQLQNNFESLEALELDFFNDQLVSYRHLVVYSPEILSQIQIFLENSEKHQQQLLEAIKNRKTAHLPRISKHFFSGIQEIVERLEETILELRNSSKSVIITQLRHEQIELRHRQKLRQLLPGIEQYIQNAQWIAKAESSSVKRSTHHISRQYNLLFDKLVTQRYIELFEEHLQLLKFPATIKVITKGQKGETLKQIALKMDESMPTRIAQTDKVLSEGEQKAVALADFLTEVVLDDNCSAIVLDDPVTSLDFDWKDLIAPILVQESRQQQVVIFTHDLHFLYCLKEAANSYDIQLSAHWIEKRNGVPGWVFQNNTPLSESDYKKSTRANEYWQQARKEPPEAQQVLLQAGFGALRTSYEAFVIFDLFGSVVMRFGERVSIDRLKDVYVDPEIRDTVIQKVGFLSRYIEGHLHSDPYIAQKPTPDLLKQEIDEFDNLKKRHTDYRKKMTG